MLSNIMVYSGERLTSLILPSFLISTITLPKFHCSNVFALGPFPIVYKQKEFSYHFLTLFPFHMLFVEDQKIFSYTLVVGNKDE